MNRIKNLGCKLAEREGFELPVRQAVDSVDDTKLGSTSYYT